MLNGGEVDVDLTGLLHGGFLLRIDDLVVASVVSSFVRPYHDRECPVGNRGEAAPGRVADLAQ